MENYIGDKPFSIIQSYFEGKHLKQLVKHQIESYNDFVNVQIEKTINMFNPVHIVSEQDYVKEFNKYNLELYITFDNLSIYRPLIHENNGSSKLMFPQDARCRNFTYASNMTIDLNIKYVIRSGSKLEKEEILNKKFPNINIGKLPIMLKSSLCILEQYKHLHHTETDECYMDPGGYFIINGSEKTCIGQEKVAENLVHCFDISKNNNKWQWIAEIRSIPDFKCISAKQISILMSTKNNGLGYPLYAQIPRVKVPIPLFILFRALGIISDKDICNHIIININYDNNNKINDELVLLLKASIVESSICLDQESSINYITNNIMYTPHNTLDKEVGIKKKYNFTMDILNNDLFPHCKTQKQKLYFMGYMVYQLLLTSVDSREIDQRDSYLNKRIELTGTLLNNLFRNYFNKLVKDMQKQIIKEINNGSWRSVEDFLNIINLTNIYKIVKSTTIENGIKRALSTGDFCIKHTNTNNKVGVAQVLNRLTYISSLSHLRRVNTPIDKSGKLVPPRKLHNTSWGFICPVESPEGGSIGVVKNISYMTHITIPCNSNSLYTYINPYIITFEDPKFESVKNNVKVFINGCWVGVVEEPFELYNLLKEKKVKGIINIYTSIIFNYNTNEINICNDSGRLTRPLLRVKNNKLLLNENHIKMLMSSEITWDDLLTDIKLDEAVIEYIDPAEQNLSMIAMNPCDLKNKNILYNYCEIHPSTIFGIVASCTPFSQHNQAPRNTYQCAMAKQAIGVYVTNFDSRMDKTSYVLTYPTRPLVETRLMNLLKLNEIPSGSQVIVAIMTHTGYNQEDSVLINKGSIDRGLFQATIYHTEKDEDKKTNGDDEIRCRPDTSKTKGIKFGNYNKVNGDGVIPENTLVENGDIIISKIVPIKDARNDHTKTIKYEDNSYIYRTREESYIDKNYLGRNGDGYNFCKVRIRSLRKPVIGDKFSSRHGQKGTVGNIIQEENMPFTSEGIRPDIIINPHAIPSRMTIAQLKETLLGKILVQLGLFGDGTSFEKFDINDILSELQKLGYESKGNELLYSGTSGEQMETSVFIGPVFYQKLKHMVSDKMHSRSIGPMVNLTRQPAEGRSRDGGLRYGEMERDCMCSHGASRFNKGRLYDASDSFSVYVCKCCGMIVSYNDNKNIHYCKMCENRTSFDYIEIPYTCKLLFQELITMNIAPRIMTK